jgi:hypothetical protein
VESPGAAAASVPSVAAAASILGYEASWNCVSSCSAGRKPTTPIGCLPGAKKAIVGMLMMLKARDRPGFASTSTLTMSMEPSYFAASFSISGATSLHGPHQAAQKSTTTGRSLCRTSASKVASVAVLIAIGGDPFSRSAGLLDESGVVLVP